MANTTTLGASAPIVFQFQSNTPVRVITLNNEPWFVGKDVTTALGYADSTNALKQHCRGVVKRHPIVDSLGRAQEIRIISQSDMLRLIVGSKLPSAEKFERWVFEEVLPAILKTGAYALPQPRRVAPNPALVNATHVTRIESELAYTAKYMRHTRGAYNKLLKHLLHTFGLPSLHVLPADRVEEASRWLHGLRLHIIEHDICLEGFEARFLAQLLAPPQLPLALEVSPQS